MRRKDKPNRDRRTAVRRALQKADEEFVHPREIDASVAMTEEWLAEHEEVIGSGPLKVPFISGIKVRPR